MTGTCVIPSLRLLDSYGSSPFPSFKRGGPPGHDHVGGHVLSNVGSLVRARKRENVVVKVFHNP